MNILPIRHPNMPREHAGENHYEQPNRIVGPVCLQLPLLKQGELFAQ